MIGNASERVFSSSQSQKNAAGPKSEPAARAPGCKETNNGRGILRTYLRLACDDRR